MGVVRRMEPSGGAAGPRGVKTGSGRSWNDPVTSGMRPRRSSEVSCMVITAVGMQRRIFGGGRL